MEVKRKKPNIRTLSEILIDVDNSKTDVVVDKLWKELIGNKYYYSLAEISFGVEHCQQKLRVIRKELELSKLKGII